MVVTPRIVLMAERPEHAAAFASQASIRSFEIVEAPEGAAGRPPPPEHRPDILVAIVVESTDVLARAFRFWDEFGRPELVFVFADSRPADYDPLVAALRAAGMRNLLALSAAGEWLGEHAPTLAAYARARRGFEEARARLPLSPPPSLDAEDTSDPVGLHEAERRFRQAYLRALLARWPARKEAAARARVSYRALCHMLERIGLFAEDGVADEPPLSVPASPPLSLPAGVRSLDSAGEAGSDSVKGDSD